MPLSLPAYFTPVHMKSLKNTTMNTASVFKQPLNALHIILPLHLFSSLLPNSQNTNLKGVINDVKSLLADEG